MALQADYAAQMLGLNTDHMASNEAPQHSQSAMYATQQPPTDQQISKRPTSRNEPSPLRQSQVYHTRNHFRQMPFISSLFRFL